MNVDRCCDIRVLGPEFGVKNMNVCIHSALYQKVQDDGGETIVWGMFSWNTLEPLISINYRLNAATYRNIVDDYNCLNLWLFVQYHRIFNVQPTNLENCSML